MMNLTDFSIIQTNKNNERVRIDVSKEGWRHRLYSGDEFQKNYDVSYSFLEPDKLNLKQCFENFNYRDMFLTKFNKLPEYSLICKRNIMNIDNESSNGPYIAELYWRDGFDYIYHEKYDKNLGLLVSMNEVRADFTTNISIELGWGPEYIIETKNLHESIFSLHANDFRNMVPVVDIDIQFIINNCSYITANIIVKKCNNDIKYVYFLNRLFENIVEFLYRKFEVSMISSPNCTLLFQKSEKTKQIKISEFYEGSLVGRYDISTKNNKIKILHYTEPSYTKKLVYSFIYS